ncbi:hypothetical protein IJG72_01090 [bacterium]|nr:hypothetical protein [bacterium]
MSKLDKLKELPLFKKKYDCIFSLGSACFCAEMLTKSNLRVFSSTFDWLGGGSFTQRILFICNDFKDFLNIEGLKKIGEREYPESCDIYLNEQTSVVFNHDFPKGMDLAESYKIVKSNFDRKNNRLIKKIQDSKNTLIVYMNDCDKNESVEQVIEMAKYINSHFNKNTIDILFVTHSPNMAHDKVEINEVSENVYVADVFNFNENGDVGNYDACKQFLSKIKIKKSFKEMLFKISKGRKRMRVYLFGIKIFSFEYHK